MRPEIIAAVRDWLANALEDIDTAVLTAEATPPKRRAAVYHAQQAAEKAPKAYLTLHDRPFDLTHRLPLLLGLCAELEADFGAWREAAEIVTPYATRFRYPGPPGTPQAPDAEEVLDAVRQARRRLDFVLSRIPAAAHLPGS